jgi:MSHA biogenesis protein MshQ
MRTTLLALALVLLAGCESVAGLGDVNPGGDDVPDADVPPNLLDGCQAWFEMSETAWDGTPGEVYDSCGGDDNGTAAAGAQTMNDPARGRVALFVGDPSSIEIPDRPELRATTELTMSAWVYPTQLGGDYGIISKRVSIDNANAYNIFVSGDRVWVDLETDDDRFPVPDSVLALDTWRMITVVYDGNAPEEERVRVYLDDEPPYYHGETSSSLGENPTANLWVGCLPLNSPAQSWNGFIDDAIVWTRALSDSEVEAWYDMTNP